MSFESSYNEILQLGILFFCIVISILSLISYIKLNKRLRILFRGKSGIDIEERLILGLKKIDETLSTNEVILRKIKNLQSQLKISFKKMSLVRYNPFSEVGSNQSFSLCLLDSDDNGVIISGLYSRGVSNLYAKEVKDGRSAHNLSKEENDVLTDAVSKYTL